MAKKTVALLFGGVSSEHEVQLQIRGLGYREYRQGEVRRHHAGHHKVRRLGSKYRGPVDTLKKCEWERSGYIVPAFISPSAPPTAYLRAPGRSSQGI